MKVAVNSKRSAVKESAVEEDNEESAVEESAVVEDDEERDEERDEESEQDPPPRRSKRQRERGKEEQDQPPKKKTNQQVAYPCCVCGEGLVSWKHRRKHKPNYKCTKCEKWVHRVGKCAAQVEGEGKESKVLCANCAPEK